MFQTDLLHALQSYRTQWPTHFFAIVNQLGYSEFQIPLVIVIIFAVNYRKGFLLAQILLYNGVATDALKTFFALPRPEDVDSTLWLPGGEQSASPFVERDAAGFFARLPEDVVAHYRALPGHSYGLPSGHVSSTVTLFGGMAVAFRKWPLWALAAAISVLVAAARMYFSRHFLADVLAGALLGGFFVLLLSFAIAALRKHDFLAQPSARRALLLWLPVLLFVVPGADPEAIGRVLGLNLGFYLVARRGLPVDDASVLRRAARVAIAFAVYGVLTVIVSLLVEAALGETTLADFLGQFISISAGFWAATLVNLKTGCFCRREDRLPS